MVGTVCVFCGSSEGAREEYAEAARRLGAALAGRGMRLVFGGGRVGLMGVVADAVLDAGGEAVGVMPEALLEKEIGHQGLTELRVAGTMHERKAIMADLADAFVALPGGYGTFEEFLEMLTWAQLSLHEKPCGLLDTAGFYGPLVSLFDHAASEGFVRAEHRSLILLENDPERMLDLLQTHTPPATGKWVAPEEL
jgi:uncharacterized protein (TIGR00730 family)